MEKAYREKTTSITRSWNIKEKNNYPTKDESKGHIFIIPFGM
jgi:hypothetical protein